MISVVVRLGVRSPGMANNDSGGIGANRGASVTLSYCSSDDNNKSSVQKYNYIFLINTWI